MLTKLTDSKTREITCDFLEVNSLRFDYTQKFLNELGYDEIDIIEPQSDQDSWLLEGELYGLPVSATFNTYENLSLSVFSKKVPYEKSIKNTFNNFMSVYRESWYEHNKGRK